MLLLAQLAVASPFGDADALLKQGKQRVEQYIDHFRKTGDLNAQLPELQTAHNELIASYEGLVAKRDYAGAAMSAITLGDIERMQNRFDGAASYYSKGRDLARQVKNPGYESKALVNLARTEASRGNLSAAVNLVSDAISLATQSADPDLQYNALEFAGNFQIKLRDPAAAAAYLDRALALSSQLKDRSLLFYGYLDRGDVYEQRGTMCDYQRDYQACLEALELARSSYRKAMDIARELGYAFLVGQVQDFLGTLDVRKKMIESSGRVDKSLNTSILHPRRPEDVLVTKQFAAGANPEFRAQLEKILKAYPGLLSGDDARTAYIRGKLEEIDGHPDGALAWYLKAVDLLEKDRRKLHDDQSRGTFLEDKIEFYYTAALALMQRGRLAEAFDVLERSRSRAMADLLATRSLDLRSPKERELFSQLTVLRTSIAQAQRELFGLTASPDREKHRDKVDRLERQIADLQTQDEQLQAAISKDAPKLAELTISQPVKLETMQRSARAEDYDLLYYLVLAHATILWHINGEKVEVMNVFAPGTVVTERVAALRTSLTQHENDANAQFDEQTSRELFLFLIQPALKNIRSHHLVIVPHEALITLPFQVLQNPKDGTYLGESYQITYAPSATVLTTLQRPDVGTGRLLAVADPGLSDAVAEVKAIGRLYPRSKLVTDSAVTKDQLKSWASDYNLLHLSMHGTFRAADPLLSYLELGPGPSDHLTAAEMFGLPLPKNSLVVLSACETGQVAATHANEILGMTRALLYAGASDLVLSGWKVDSKATSLWMETFYRNAKTKPPSEAAQLALIAVKARPEYRHPYFWGPFLITGK